MKFLDVSNILPAIDSHPAISGQSAIGFHLAPLSVANPALQSNGLPHSFTGEVMNPNNNNMAHTPVHMPSNPIEEMLVGQTLLGIN